MKAIEAPILEIRNVSVSFALENGDYHHVLKRVSLLVGRGEIVGIMGPSGGGKTTLVQGLLGLLRASPGVWEGEAFLDGRPLLPPSGEYVKHAAGKSDGKIRKREASFRRTQENLLRNLRGRDVAVIFQEPRAALDPFFTVGEHMLESLRRAGISAASGTTAMPNIPKEALQAQGIALLEDVGLEKAGQLWSAFPHQLSGGMAQRVMIAMALCAKPKLLVADEPSTALDLNTRAKLLELLRGLKEKHGLSILIISHDPNVIRAICQRSYVLNPDVLNPGALIETAQIPGPAEKSPPFISAHSHTFLKTALPASPAGTPSLLEVQGLRKRFRRAGKSFFALDGVSLSLREGETYALVGESGSGKSTLALSILALQEVDDGKILYKGEDLVQADRSRMRMLRREIRLLFQHPEAALNSGMTVSAILAEGLEKDGEFSRAEIRLRVAEVLERVHLRADALRRHPANLSSGEKQRVAIARALITHPKLLVCDEPVASLDLAVQGRILELLRELQGKMGLTCLFISHNLEWVKGMAQRVGVMYQGKIVEELSMEHFNLERAQHPYTRLLLASSPTE